MPDDKKKKKDVQPQDQAEAQVQPESAEAQAKKDAAIESVDKAKKTVEASLEKAKKAEEKARKEELSRMMKTLGIKQGLMHADNYESIKEVISTGDVELDRLITPLYFEQHGVGGVPRGYLCEIYGPFGGGKSTICMKIIANACKKGHKCLWVDAESSYQPPWAEAQGVDNSKCLRLDQFAAANGEEFLEIIEKAALSGEYAVIVVDSLMGLQPKAILETPLDENAKMGAYGAMTSRAMPRLATACMKGNTTVIFINQMRMKIGVMFGNPETTPGGEALKYFASLRLSIRPVSGKANRGIMKEGAQIGVRSNTKLEKTRFGPPGTEAVISIYFTNEKAHPIDQLIDVALSKKLIKCRTVDQVQQFSYDELRGVRGMDDFREQLTDDILLRLFNDVQGTGTVLDPEVVEYIKIMKDGGLGEKPTIESDELT
jgi:recombination protein RecA